MTGEHNSRATARKASARPAPGGRLVSIEAEQSVLGGLMTFGADMAKGTQAQRIALEDFSRADHRLIWSAIERVTRQGFEPGPVAVLDELARQHADDAAGGLTYLNALCESVISLRAALSLAKKLSELTARRRMDAIGKAIQQAAGGPLGADELRERAEALGRELQSVGGPLDGPQGIPFEWASDFSASVKAPLEILEGVLSAGRTSITYGEPGSGKSYLISHLAICIAQGVPWLGRRTTKGMVVYVAAEGAMSIRLRLAAHHKHFGREIGNFALIPEALNLLDPSADVDALIQLINSKSSEISELPRLVVVDTVAMVMAGGDENTAVDMGRLVRSLARIRDATGAHVMGIHHAGKDTSRGARGHSSLRGSLDTEIEVTADEATTTHTARIRKQRDLSGVGDRLFGKFVSVELGRNQWGNPITACVVVDVEASEMPNEQGTGPARMTASQRAVLGYLAGQQSGIRRPELVKALAVQGLAAPTIYRALNEVLALGLATNTGGLIYAPKG